MRGNLVCPAGEVPEQAHAQLHQVRLAHLAHGVRVRLRIKRDDRGRTGESLDYLSAYGVGDRGRAEESREA